MTGTSIHHGALLQLWAGILFLVMIVLRGAIPLQPRAHTDHCEQQSHPVAAIMLQYHS